MSMLNLQLMQKIAEDTFAFIVRNHFKNEGVEALRSLIEGIRHLYKYIEPASRKHPLKIFIQLKPLDLPPPIHDIAHANRIMHELDDDCIVQIAQNGRFKVFDPTALNLEELSERAIVYVFSDEGEEFVINKQSKQITNPHPIHTSVFSQPTFSSLEDALDTYRVNVVSHTNCYQLKTAWNDDKRIFWQKKPEATMRRSLEMFLQAALRDAEVRPEQNVDETHPVDLKITWSDTNRRALIEIKWLGQSKSEDGELATGYSASRARDGADQLANYLDLNKASAPRFNTKGYLVIFDGRRRSLNKETISIDEDNGFYYRDKVIIYDPPHHEIRNDFAAPIRMFAEPIVNR